MTEPKKPGRRKSAERAQPPAEDAGERRITRGSPRKQAEAPAGPAIYQLKITLDHIRPPVWRRVLVPDCTLETLHHVIQAAMGWYNCHLHIFEVNGIQFGKSSPGWDVEEESAVRLSDLAAKKVKKIHYAYDMGDDWGHTVLIEKVLEPEPGQHYPVCTAGKRACPPEDCGGPWGYADFLDAIADPGHEAHADMVEWIGRKFDSEAFDLDATNRELRRVRV